MSAETAVGIVLVITLVITLVVVGVMFWWGAREDGRDQKRIDAQLRDEPEDGSEP
jgi:Tfp pilus assembly protein PilX